MKTALKKALVSRLEETQGFFSILNVAKLFEGEAPGGTKDPYVVYSVISYTNISTFSEEMYDILLQFSLFSSNESTLEIGTLETEVNDKNLYKNQRFDFEGGTVIDMEFLQSDGPRKVTEETSDGEDSYWQTDIDYHIIIQKDQE